MKSILFIGPLSYKKKTTKGAILKNQHLFKFFKSRFTNVDYIDTVNYKANPFIILSIIYNVAIKKNDNIVLATSSKSTYYIVTFFTIFKIKRNFFYWVVGGDFLNFVKSSKKIKKYLNNFIKIIVEGQQLKIELNKLCIYNCISVPNLRNFSYLPKLKSNTKCTKFIFFSRICPEKGVDLIINSSLKINELDYLNNYSIDFYGNIDKDYKELFFEQIRDISNISFNGILDLNKSKNYDILSSYDVLLFPSYFEGEGFPGVLIDAFISGLPVIASDWNLNSEIVENGVTGLLIEPKSSDELTKAMLSFIDGGLEIEKMSINCQKSCFKYKIDNVLNDELLKEIMLL